MIKRETIRFNVSLSPMSLSQSFQLVRTVWLLQSFDLSKEDILADLWPLSHVCSNTYFSHRECLSF